MWNEWSYEPELFCLQMGQTSTVWFPRVTRMLLPIMFYFGITEDMFWLHKIQQRHRSAPESFRCLFKDKNAWGRYDFLKLINEEDSLIFIKSLLMVKQ